MTKENKPEAHRLERQKRKPCYEVFYERLYNDPGNGLLTPAGYLYCLIQAYRKRIDLFGEISLLQLTAIRSTCADLGISYSGGG